MGAGDLGIHPSILGSSQPGACQILPDRCSAIRPQEEKEMFTVFVPRREGAGNLGGFWSPLASPPD